MGLAELRAECEKDSRRRARVREVLAVFHLDNGHFVERVLQDYKDVYCDRPAVRGFRKCEAKDRLAMAFAVCRQLNRLGAPRPPGQVAAVCGVPDPGTLLRVDKLLNMSKSEVRRGLHELPDAKPVDFVDLICGNLALPRRLACLVRNIIVSAKLRWLMYGRNPRHIAGGVLHSVLVKLGEGRPGEMARRIAEELDCSERCVLAISNRMPEYVIESEWGKGLPGHSYEDLIFSLGIWSTSSNTPMRYSFRMRE